MLFSLNCCLFYESLGEIKNMLSQYKQKIQISVVVLLDLRHLGPFLVYLHPCGADF